jgi:hypothetical protein
MRTSARPINTSITDGGESHALRGKSPSNVWPQRPFRDWHKLSGVDVKIAFFVLLSLLLGGCSPDNVSYREDSNAGRIRGVFHLDERTLRGPAWVEMIQLTGPPGLRCGPGDCGLDVDALRFGAEWNPGRWRVFPPEVDDWRRPDPFEIVVKTNEVTFFEADYQAIGTLAP